MKQNAVNTFFKVPGMACLKTLLAYKILAYRKDTENIRDPLFRIPLFRGRQPSTQVHGGLGCGGEICIRKPDARGEGGGVAPAEALSRHCQLRRKFLVGPGGNLGVLAASVAARVGCASLSLSRVGTGSS